MVDCLFEVHWQLALSSVYAPRSSLPACITVLPAQTIAVLFNFRSVQVA